MTGEHYTSRFTTSDGRTVTPTGSLESEQDGIEVSVGPGRDTHLAVKAAAFLVDALRQTVRAEGPWSLPFFVHGGAIGKYEQQTGASTFPSNIGEVLCQAYDVATRVSTDSAMPRDLVAVHVGDYEVETVRDDGDGRLQALHFPPQRFLETSEVAR